MEALDELSNRWEAEGKLAELESWEQVAQQAENDPRNYMRRQYAAFFERQFGFSHTLRQEVRRAMESIAETGACAVQEVLNDFQASGFSSAGS